MDRVTTSRRALLRAASTAVAYASGAAIVTGGMALATNAKGETLGMTPFRLAEARYRAAEKHFNAIPGAFEESNPADYARETETYLASVRAVDSAPVETWEEFADAFKIACDDGASIPPEHVVMKLYADVCRLSRGA